MKSSIIGKSGYEANVTADGKLQVEANVSVDSVTVTDVTIKDAETATHKLKVNSDGSILAQLTGSNVKRSNINGVSSGITVEPGATYEVDVFDWDSAGVGSVYYAINLFRSSVDGGIAQADYEINLINRFDLDMINPTNRTFRTLPTSSVVETDQAAGGGAWRNIITKAIYPVTRVHRITVKNVSAKAFQIYAVQRMGFTAQNGDGGRERNVIEASVFNAVAVTNTTQRSSGDINVSAFADKKYLHVSNTLNQDITMYLLVKVKSGLAGIGVPAVAVTVAKNSIKMLTGTDIPALDLPLQIVEVRFTAAAAPTSGSVSMWLEGGIR